MSVRTITITDPARGLSTLIHPRTQKDVAWQGLQFEAAVRAVEEDNIGAHGSADTTQYFSSGALSLSLHFMGTYRAFLDEFGQYMEPQARPVIIVDDSEWAAPRQVMLRFDSSAKPIQSGMGIGRDAQFSWKAPHGVWEAQTPLVSVVNAFIASAVGLTVGSSGLAVTVTGVAMPATLAPNPSQVISPGNVKSPWAALLYGPCSGPKLANDTAGMTIEFSPSLVLGAGEYILLGSDGTMLRNGNPGGNVEGFLNFPASDFWLIQPGLNIIRYYPASANSGSVAQITFSPCWAP